VKQFKEELIIEVRRAMEARLLQEKQPVGEPSDSAGIQSFIEKSRQIQTIEKLPGDASTRKYYRIKTHASGNQPATSLIVMVMESFEEKGEGIPFIAVQKHLAQYGVDVPKIIDFDPQNGFIMLEDLGDITLLRCLQDVSDFTTERKFFERAIDALVDMHCKTGPDKILNASEKLDGFGLRFDQEKLMWEVNFTMEHFYLKHLQRHISDADMKVIQDGFNQICKELAAEPTVFTHRDYHSRNLMVSPSAVGANVDVDSRFTMIDFQDARMGPCQYDLASLLRDSYYQLDEKQIHSLTRYYLDQMRAKGRPIENVAQFDRMFDLMAVQRNFKAIGSFASFLNRRGNPAYLKFIGNTFENIRRNLLRYPEFKNLREVLFHYYYF
jgi:aminoglycoside/choline kinase family phosphotransferase